MCIRDRSYCGFTKQYEGLQKLWEKYESKGLIVLGVPSNSFNQEKKSDNACCDSSNPDLYLASQSPRRALLLEQLSVDFSVLAVDIDESQAALESPND